MQEARCVCRAGISHQMDDVVGVQVCQAGDDVVRHLSPPAKPQDALRAPIRKRESRPFRENI